MVSIASKGALACAKEFQVEEQCLTSSQRRRYKPGGLLSHLRSASSLPHVAFEGGTRRDELEFLNYTR